MERLIIAPLYWRSLISYNDIPHQDIYQNTYHWGQLLVFLLALEYRDRSSITLDWL